MRKKFVGVFFYRAAACLLIAAENCSDSIEIASFDTERGDCVLQVSNQHLYLLNLFMNVVVKCFIVCSMPIMHLKEILVIHERK